MEVISPRKSHMFICSFLLTSEEKCCKSYSCSKYFHSSILLEKCLINMVQGLGKSLHLLLLLSLWYLLWTQTMIVFFLGEHLSLN